MTHSEYVEFDETTDEEFIDAGAERDRLSQAVVSTTDWTSETLLAQLKRGNIQLNPRFQRRDAWSKIRKSRYIESLILGLPVPQIVLAERKDSRGKYIVLDGKQRLLSLLQFEGSAQGKMNAFSLSGLEVLADPLEGKTYRELSTDLMLSDLNTAFLNQSVRAVIIKNWPDLLFLHLVFLRLNTGSVKLSPQELRQAMFPGDFSDFVDDSARDSTALLRLLQLSEPDFRMRDVELLVRHLAFRNFISDYRGELKIFLDSACEIFNSEWNMRSGELTQQVVDFNDVINSLIEIWGVDEVARRPVQAGRRPFNRALFDVISYYAVNNVVRQAMLTHRTEVVVGLAQLYENDREFARSIESTTKTIEATYTRFSRWGRILQGIIGVNLPIPQFVNGRIVL